MRVRQDRRVKKATKGRRAPKASKGRPDLKARWDNKVRRGHPVPPVPTVRAAASVRPDQRVRPVHRAPPAPAACTRSPSRHAAPDATSSAASAKGWSPSPARAVPCTFSKVMKRTRRHALAHRDRQSRYACVTKLTRAFALHPGRIFRRQPPKCRVVCRSRGSKDRRCTQRRRKSRSTAAEILSALKRQRQAPARGRQPSARQPPFLEAYPAGCFYAIRATPL